VEDAWGSAAAFLTEVRETTPGELGRALGWSERTVSRHLSAWRAAGRIEGTTKRIRLAGAATIETRRTAPRPRDETPPKPPPPRATAAASTPTTTAKPTTANAAARTVERLPARRDSRDVLLEMVGNGIGLAVAEARPEPAPPLALPSRWKPDELPAPPAVADEQLAAAAAVNVAATYTQPISPAAVPLADEVAVGLHAAASRRPRPTPPTTRVAAPTRYLRLANGQVVVDPRSRP